MANRKFTCLYAWNPYLQILFVEVFSAQGLVCPVTLGMLSVTTMTFSGEGQVDLLSLMSPSGGVLPAKPSLINS
jgi:hypothetical protein